MEREEEKEKVFDMVAKSHKRYKPGDLARSLARSLGLDKKEVKAAINDLVGEGRIIYSYSGHSWLELPPES